LPFALGFIALILLIRPFVVIKFFKVNPWRIGHLLVDIEIARLNAIHASKTKKHFVIYYFPERRAANEYVIQMWNRALPTARGSLGWTIYELASLLANKKLTVSPTNRDTQGLTIQYPTNWKFADNEIEDGHEFLRSVGCYDNKFVCLFVRDSAYLETIRTDKSFSYYKNRNSDISTYLQAAEALTELGYTVFRMGHYVKDSLVSANAKIIDYASNGMRTEFLDVFLGATCKFCISTGAGFDNIPQLFRRPVLYANVVGFVDDLIYSPLLFYPKIYRDTRTQKLLSFNEIVERGIENEVHAPEIEASGTMIEDLRPHEITEAVKEMAARFEGRFTHSRETKTRNIQVISFLSARSKLQSQSYSGEVRGEFASCFLSRYPNFLDGLE
jgi:putative glycosyltransferase (TIGR04372 family)